MRLLHVIAIGGALCFGIAAAHDGSPETREAIDRVDQSVATVSGGERTFPFAGIPAPELASHFGQPVSEPIVLPGRIFAGQFQDESGIGAEPDLSARGGFAAARVQDGGDSILLVAAGSPECAPDVVHIRSGGTEARFSVEIADTPEAQSRGLMFREHLPRFAGMLFVYDRPQRATFWMANTPLPLDMLFFDEAGVLRSVHANATPLSHEGIDGGQGILYVLEINGGMAAELGIEPGAELRHPAVDSATAAWPCSGADARG